MKHRPRWALLGLGAIIVLLLFTYPLWRTAFTGATERVIFPLVEPAQRDVLARMPSRDAAATAYAVMLTIEPVPTEAQPAPLPPDAQAILTGEFRALDAVHTAQGDVTVYRLVDDSVLMRFTDFRVTNAPRLTVYLSGNEDPRTLQDLGGVVPEFLVGELLGNVGDQQFAIPRELRLERYRSVVIFSEALQTIYSSAPLR